MATSGLTGSSDFFSAVDSRNNFERNGETTIKIAPKTQDISGLKVLTAVKN